MTRWALLAAAVYWSAGCGDSSSDSGGSGEAGSTQASSTGGTTSADATSADATSSVDSSATVGESGTDDTGGDAMGLDCAPIECGESPGATIEVHAGGDLQAALDQAAQGDTIVLDAGATFTGSFVLPAKTGEGCLTVRTSTPDEMLPPGDRVGPADAPLLARVISPGSGLPAIATVPGAHHVRLIGLEIAPESAASEVYQVVAFGSSGPEQSTLDQVPHHLVLERSWVHGWPDANFKRGVALDSADTCIADSTVDDFHSDFQDSQAVGGFNGPGPFRIVNNRLEGGAENIMFGGATPAIPDLVPTDIVVRGNHLYKPLAWKAGDPANSGYVPWVKNLFEIKNGRDVVLDGNVLENNWVGADQHGVAIVLTPRGENGTAPWASCENVTITNNILRHVGGGVSVLGFDDGGPSQQSTNIVVANNVFEDIRADYALDIVRVVQFTHVAGLELRHNVFATADTTYPIFRTYGEPTTDFVFADNVVFYGEGAWAECGTDQAALDCLLPGGAFARNVVMGGQGTLPAENFFAADPAAVGFVDWPGAAADYHGYALARSSPYAGMGTDGTSPGIDASAIDEARGTSEPP